MSEPFLVTEALTDTILVDPEGTLDAALVISVPVDTIELETDVLVGQGPQGEPGEPPPVSRYDYANVAVSSGVLTLNAAAASTFYAILNQNVSSVVVTSWSEDQAQRIHIYVAQDATGGRYIDDSAWPTGTRWPGGTAPDFGGGSFTIDSFILEHLPTSNLTFGMLVGQQYA